MIGFQNLGPQTFTRWAPGVRPAEQNAASKKPRAHNLLFRFALQIFCIVSVLHARRSMCSGKQVHFADVMTEDLAAVGHARCGMLRERGQRKVGCGNGAKALGL